jgi:hypothetical protein
MSVWNSNKPAAARFSNKGATTFRAQYTATNKKFYKGDSEPTLVITRTNGQKYQKREIRDYSDNKPQFTEGETLVYKIGKEIDFVYKMNKDFVLKKKLENDKGFLECDLEGLRNKLADVVYLIDKLESIQADAKAELERELDAEEERNAEEERDDERPRRKTFVSNQFDDASDDDSDVSHRSSSKSESSMRSGN